MGVRRRALRKIHHACAPKYLDSLAYYREIRRANYADACLSLFETLRACSAAFFYLVAGVLFRRGKSEREAVVSGRLIGFLAF